MSPDEFSASMLLKYQIFFPQEKIEVLRSLIALAFQEGVVEGANRVQSAVEQAFHEQSGARA